MRLALCMGLAVIAAAGQGPARPRPASNKPTGLGRRPLAPNLSAVAFYDPEILTAGSHASGQWNCRDSRHVDPVLRRVEFRADLEGGKAAVGASGAIGNSRGARRNGHETGAYLAVWRKQRERFLESAPRFGMELGPAEITLLSKPA